MKTAFLLAGGIILFILTLTDWMPMWFWLVIDGIGAIFIIRWIARYVRISRRAKEERIARRIARELRGEKGLDLDNMEDWEIEEIMHRGRRTEE